MSGRPRALPQPDESQLQALLRSCLGRFATGVAVVTFQADDGPHGFTVNSFTSVSLRPPLVLVCVARAARSHDRLAGRPFCVNVLGAEQEPLARAFAGAGGAQAGFESDELAPRLPGSLAHLSCRPWRSYDGGDHTLYLGEVADFDYRSGEALGYLGGRFIAIAEPELGLEHLL
ncbi:MAG TPA: flavin reductase family protein [Solirubrobacteraceae bacterium]|nr:flavin reductase family protein [Solirubrobacteraceae bacterium]